MPKRKREDDGAEKPIYKAPKRDKSKYTKNVDPNTTKAERKEARRKARLQRKAVRSKAKKLRIQEEQTREEERRAAAGETAQDDQSTLNGDASSGQPDTEDVAAAAGPNAKARRKALRKAERLASEKEQKKRRKEEAAKAQRKSQASDDTSDSESSESEDSEPEQSRTTDAVRRLSNGHVEQSSIDKSTPALLNGDSEQPTTAKATPALSNGDVEQPLTAKPTPASTKGAARASKKSTKATLDQASSDSIVNDSKTSAEALAETSLMATSHAAYATHSKLAALPESEITKFLGAQQIAVKDAGEELRPIISFDYLPDLEASVSPFKGFTAPTPIQAATWPYLLAGRDVIGVAETGSGKTLAFGVPCIHRLAAIKKKERKHIKACIVSPTRELALQIQEQLSKFSQPYGLKVTCVYGGMDKGVQREALKGTQIVVATPGRLNDFIQEGSIDLSHADYLVLDEADRMLDKGFEEEVRKIASNTAQQGRQTLMFTATWPQSVRDLAATFMSNPVRVLIGDNTTGELRANTRIVQEVEVIGPKDKQQRLFQLLKQYQSGKNKKDRILVFCLYKKEAARIEDFIRYKGFDVVGIHGDLSQQKRMDALEAFKNGSVPLLVATDVAARGLDIPAVKLVINVTFPLTAEDYVHRIGRTGRAGQDGRAITLFTEEEKHLAGALINVLKAAGQPVPEELLKFGTTVKRKAHDAYGAFYKDPTDMKKATKITFD